jgi:hypothetical protein
LPRSLGEAPGEAQPRIDFSHPGTDR